ncbi:hypothetical protein BACCIP111895_01128 [Neobacillus rhizosphaerae]|uniref:Uncharacterized protein n=1 Tax=Neobacillus rhizosphaerae TaxID=2880965 RepID=A0ABM9EPB7_9BACI|nr:hypothetical protein BACCIP111895_01128 [Neobacillus rhizosphaerae]
MFSLLVLVFIIYLGALTHAFSIINIVTAQIKDARPQWDRHQIDMVSGYQKRLFLCNRKVLLYIRKRSPEV